MTPTKRDELAKLAYAFAQCLPKREAKQAVAGMLRTQIDCDENLAWALIVRGKHLAEDTEKQSAIAVASLHGDVA